jgi:hypothetical protein
MAPFVWMLELMAYAAVLILIAVAAAAVLICEGFGAWLDSREQRRALPR